MISRLMASLLTIAIVSGCDSGNSLHHFRTTAPDLNYLSTFTGRLAVRDNCVVLVLGPKMLSRSDIVGKDDPVAIPLFNDGFSIENGGQDFILTTPEGLKVRSGSVVTGEGGPFPTKPLDPRSAPVNDPPDISPCRGKPYQVNTMYISELERIYP